MTERFGYDSALEKVYDYDKPIEYSFESYGVFECCNIMNDLSRENEQLKQQLNDITLEWKQNRIKFNKDELYVKDNNTEITLKNQNLLIQVYIPKIKEHLRFDYIVTGRRLEREYNTLKGDVE